MNKNFILLLILSVSFYMTFAQQKTFLRIYDQSGSKFAKGLLVGTTDSSVLITGKRKTEEILYTKIDIIKTKRSFGHSVILGATIGSMCGISLGVFSHGVSSKAIKTNPIEKDIVGGFAFGAMTGSLCGAIIGLLKKRTTFIINGNKENWLEQKTAIDKLPKKLTHAL